MTSETQIVPSLQEVQQKFDAWRANKNGSRQIPEHLWLNIEILLKHHSVSVIKKIFRLSSTQLNQKKLLRKTDEPKKKIATSFLEVPMLPTTMMSTGSTATPTLLLKRGEKTLSLQNPTRDQVQLFINAMR